MNRRKEVIIMRGISGSGKSTAIIEDFPEHAQKDIRLSGSIWTGGKTLFLGKTFDTEPTLGFDKMETRRIISADHFFHVEGGAKYGEVLFSGMYKFDSNKLGDAHAVCFHTFVEHLMDDHIADVLYVDNTNCNLWEISPYIQTAHKFGWNVKIIEIICDVEKAYKRTQHQVPLHAIQTQEKALHFNKIPPFWNNITVERRTAK